MVATRTCKACGQAKSAQEFSWGGWVKDVHYRKARCRECESKRRSPNKDKRPTLDQLFWSRVRKSDGCWEWTGHLATGGYGHTSYRRPDTEVMAHRESWRLSRGPIPVGALVLHSCDNPCCVKPDHLFLGTAADNMHDMVLKLRGIHGEKSARAKMTAGQVLQIPARIERGETQESIAREFGVQRPAIWKILAGKSWRHLNVRRAT